MSNEALCVADTGLKNNILNGAIGITGTPCFTLYPPNPEIRPWRQVTDEDVDKAIRNTPLEPVIRVLEAPTNPPLPLQVTVPRALALAGSILSKPVPGWQNMNHGATGPELARFRINTGGRGQMSVIWTLTAGRTGTGKNIGDPTPTLSNRFGVAIGTLASSAGLYEGLADMGAGLLTVPEFESYLDKSSSRASASVARTSIDLRPMHPMPIHRHRRNSCAAVGHQCLAIARMAVSSR